MIGLSIHLDAEQHPMDLPNVTANGTVSAVGLLRHGTATGKASVAIVITLDDGSQVLGQTTWALLRTAFGALAASPAVAEEVIDP